MGIAAEIARVRTEFVAGEDLLDAVQKQEGVTEIQAASWFLRNIEKLDKLEMVAFSRERDDFRTIERPWASDLFLDIASNPESDTQQNCEWDENHDGYVGGWLSSQVKEFFSNTDVSFPGESLQLNPADPAISSRASRNTVSVPAVGSELVPKKALPCDETLTTKERTTLLCIIAALAHEARIDLVRPSKAATLVLDVAAKLGVRLGQRTVEEWLKRVPEAMDRKSI